MYGSPEIGTGLSVGGSGYPIRLEIILPARNSRFFAIPIIGYLARWLLLIPHYFVLGFLGIGVALTQLFLWIPVLFGGRYPRWGYSFVGGYLRWNIRVLAYAYGLTDSYPPFRLSN